MTTLPPTVLFLSYDKPFGRILQHALSDLRVFQLPGNWPLGDSTSCFPEPLLCKVVFVDLSLAGGQTANRMVEVGQHWSAPVIALIDSRDPGTAKAAVERGAMDYLEKPFTRHNLLAAFEIATAPLIVETNHQTVTVDAWDLVLDRQIGTLTMGCWKTMLSYKEAAILSVLAARVRQPTTIDQVIAAARADGIGDSFTLVTTVAGLRLKLHRDHDCPLRVQTEGGVGYRLTLK